MEQDKIPEAVRKAVREQVLRDLEEYFNQAEEHEDLEVMGNPDVEGRTKDFYLYQSEVTKEQDRNRRRQGKGDTT